MEIDNENCYATPHICITLPRKHTTNQMVKHCIAPNGNPHWLNILVWFCSFELMWKNLNGQKNIITNFNWICVQSEYRMLKTDTCQSSCQKCHSWWIVQNTQASTNHPSFALALVTRIHLKYKCHRLRKLCVYIYIHTQHIYIYIMHVSRLVIMVVDDLKYFSAILQAYECSQQATLF